MKDEDNGGLKDMNYTQMWMHQMRKKAIDGIEWLSVWSNTSTHLNQ